MAGTQNRTLLALQCTQLGAQMEIPQRCQSAVSTQRAKKEVEEMCMGAPLWAHLDLQHLLIHFVKSPWTLNVH